MTDDAERLAAEEAVPELAIVGESIQELAEVVDLGSDVVLVATKVSKAFGGLVAVREIDLEIPRGSIVSLIGPNGAGKTTFFNVIAGILDPTAGHVAFGGRMMIARPIRAWLEPVIWVAPSLILSIIAAIAYIATENAELTSALILVALLVLIVMFLAAIVRPSQYVRLLLRVGVFRSARPNDMVKAGIGRTFQNIRLFANMTALENVQVGMHHRLTANAADALFSTPRARAEERESAEKAVGYLGLVGMRDRRDELAKNLPYGDQRRLELARALASEPTLLLLDEPTAGMNPRETQEMTQLIDRLRRTLGLSILLIEHDMKVVMGISDQIYVLDHGELIARGDPNQVRSNPKVIEAYLGTPPE
jgi:ABC-type branched-subunit amino acid transport system ATPase component